MWDGEGDETVFEGSSSIVPGRRDSSEERLAAIRAHWEDEFSNFINENFRDEEDRAFYDYLALEYPWLMANSRGLLEELDHPDDEYWLRYERNCYINSIYTRRF